MPGRYPRRAHPRHHPTTGHSLLPRRLIASQSGELSASQQPKGREYAKLTWNVTRHGRIRSRPIRRHFPMFDSPGVAVGNQVVAVAAEVVEADVSDDREVTRHLSLVPSYLVEEHVGDVVPDDRLDPRADGDVPVTPPRNATISDRPRSGLKPRISRTPSAQKVSAEVVSRPASPDQLYRARVSRIRSRATSSQISTVVDSPFRLRMIASCAGEETSALPAGKGPAAATSCWPGVWSG